MYPERLLDHFRNPRNAGELPPPAITVEVTQPVCGDILQLSARFEEGRVVEARFRAKGCTPSMAAGSALTVLVAGKTHGELRALRPADVEEAVGGLPAEARHAALLCVDAVRALVARAATPGAAR